jgi:2'-5' RNA ligase
VPNVPQAHYLFCTHVTILLVDKAQVEACLSPFGDSGSVDAKKVRRLCLMYHQLESHLGRTRWNS